MKTTFLLMAEFGSPTVPLDKVAEKYFSIATKAEATRRAQAHSLPIPAFRMGGQRSQWFVHIDALAKYIDDCNEEAQKAWRAMNDAA